VFHRGTGSAEIFRGNTSVWLALVPLRVETKWELDDDEDAAWNTNGISAVR
jgi:hypothetical protein